MRYATPYRRQAQSINKSFIVEGCAQQHCELQSQHKVCYLGLFQRCSAPLLSPHQREGTRWKQLNTGLHNDIKLVQPQGKASCSKPDKRILTVRLHMLATPPHCSKQNFKALPIEPLSRTTSHHCTTL